VKLNNLEAIDSTFCDLAKKVDRQIDSAGQAGRSTCNIFRNEKNFWEDFYSAPRRV
jgi:hypothetical protein